MKYCKKCGYKIKNENAEFCTNCGTAIKSGKTNFTGISKLATQHKKGVSIVVAIVVVIIAFSVILKSCGSSEDKLIGTWELQSVNGEESWPDIQISFAENGVVYDPDEVLKELISHMSVRFDVETWHIMSDSSLVLGARVTSDEEIVTYHVTSKELELSYEDNNKVCVFERVK